MSESKFTPRPSYARSIPITDDMLRETETTQGFTPSELTLPYSQWNSLVQLRVDRLRPETDAWLNAWRLWDLACSPMDDGSRQKLRYGHYLGWHARK